MSIHFDNLTVVVTASGLSANRAAEMSAAAAAWNIATRADFVEQIAFLSERPDGWVTTAGGLEYRRETGATTIADLPGWVPNGDATPDHYGADPTGTTGADGFIAAAIAAGHKVIRGTPGSTYLLGQTVLSDAPDGVTIDFTGSTLVQGPLALPGFYMRDATKTHIVGGKWQGNYATAGAWKDLLTTGGITSGDAVGSAAAAYSGVSAITLNGLGVGYVRKGDRVAAVTSGVTHGYIVQADVLIVAGSAAITLDRVLDFALTSGQTVWVDQAGRRQCIPVAYTAGTSTITVGAADVTSATGTPQLLPGDQFCFHTDSNNINEIDYSEVYTVVAGALYSGTYPNVSATVTITPALATDKVLGQRITSIQDHRNNRHSLILFTGSEDCTVDGAALSGCQLHGIAANAAVRSPWDGEDPSIARNINFKILNCIDEDGATGSAFVAAHAEDFQAIGCTARGSTTRNGVQMEQCQSGVVSLCTMEDMKTGVMVTGETGSVTIAASILNGCQIGVEQRNICRSIVITGNQITNNPAFSLIGIKVEAGLRDEELGETTYNSLCDVSGNTISGRCLVTGTYNGSSILIQPPTATTTAAASTRPHYVSVHDNIISYAGRHGIHILQGVRGRASGNIIFSPGENGICSVNGEDFDIVGNIVNDAGMLVASAAYKVDGGTGLVFANNRSPVSVSTGQTWGLETANGPVFRLNFGNWLRGTVASNVASTVDDTSSAAFGDRALESRLNDGVRNSAFGMRAGRLVTTGDNNTALGYNAGATLSTGNRNTLLGSSTDTSGASINNGIAIGYGAKAYSAELALGDDAGAANGLVVATSARAGAASALPATPTGYVHVRVNGVAGLVPFYAR